MRDPEDDDDDLVREVRQRYAENPEYLGMLAKAIEDRSGRSVTIEELKKEYGLT